MTKNRPSISAVYLIVGMWIELDITLRCNKDDINYKTGSFLLEEETLTDCALPKRHIETSGLEDCHTIAPLHGF